MAHTGVNQDRIHSAKFNVDDDAEMVDINESDQTFRVGGDSVEYGFSDEE